MKPVLEIIKKDGDALPRAFRYIVENNKSNAAPYHSLHHMLRVMYHCNEGAEYHKLDSLSRINLLVAALFHDFSHTQGKEKDDVNVQIAISGVQSWYNSNPLNETNVNIDKVVEIIKATQYPYVIPAEDLTIEQAIIRDADLMPSLEVDWINTMIVGLKEEMGVDSFLRMVEGQQAFHSGIEMCSTWGREVYMRKWEKVFKNLEILRSLL
jgi:hypothetical protein